MDPKGATDAYKDKGSMHYSIRRLGQLALLCACTLSWATRATSEAQPPVRNTDVPAPTTTAPDPSSQPATPSAAPQRRMTEFGFAVFQQRCVACHGNPAYARAPSPAVLRAMPPERIYAALTSGAMKVVGDSLSDAERRRVAESVSGRLLGSAQAGSAQLMPNRCATNPPLRSLSGAAWNGWGNGLGNTRYQSASDSGLSAANVPALRLKWAFGYPDGTSAYGQPSVVAGRVFVGTDTGYVYSLDAHTGCVYWSFQTQAGVRNAMTVGPIAGHGSTRFAVYFGDGKANAYAIDAQTGRQLWITHVDSHVTSRVTAAPALYRSRLYVAISSWEEFSARTPAYGCCTAVGNVNALNANTGKLIWKTYAIVQRPRPTHKNSLGVQQWAPAGASIWNTPTIDPRRHALYVGTGDTTTYPAAATSDAILALDMGSGKIRWSAQAHRNDTYLVGCVAPDVTENCPKVQGPDWDIPMSPMLSSEPNGRRVLLVGTKPGDILAIDPDKSGDVLWRVDVLGEAIAGDGPLPVPRAVRGPVWGGAMDAQYAYFGLNAGGVAAIRVDTGKPAWHTPLNSTPERPVAHSAAITVIPEVAFIGGSDGRLTAISTTDGSVLWSYETAREFDTVNAVAARGGSISAPGPTVSGGMLFVGSGYGVVDGMPGNVLLAFGLD
jgi:polyvinyl alcohol dehydrogenase (cytochrome)